MDHTEPVPTETRVGPTERPDDPLAAARKKATRRPLRSATKAADPARKPTPPNPDLEGCYYLG